MMAFGLEPQWNITVKVVEPEKMDGAIATSNWANHYRDATISTMPFSIKDREGWAKHLVHECYHILLADLHDYLIESTPKNNSAMMIDLVETTVSVLANVFYETYIESNGEALDKLAA